MRKLTSKRKSVSLMVLCSRETAPMEDKDTVSPLPPPGRRKSTFGLALLGQPKNPQEGPPRERRRFSISATLLGTPSPTYKKRSVGERPEFFYDTPIVRKPSAEVDYLPGLPPISDNVPVSFGFAEGWDYRIVYNTENPKLAVGRRAQQVDSNQEYMGRAMRVVVAGARRVGKTAILKQVACVDDVTNQPYEPTIDDTYQVLLEEADRPREILIFHDTGGIPDYGPIELKRAYLQVADAFVLVYSVADHESFNRVDLLRKFIEHHNSKEKREVPIVVLGNMRDIVNRKVDSDFAHAWAAKAKVKLFEVTAKDRNSLVDFVHYLGQRHFHPIKESKFSLSKKLKSEKSNAAILMDF